MRDRSRQFCLPPPLLSLLLTLLLALSAGWAEAAKAPISITKAIHKNGALLVKGVNKAASSGTLDLFDLSGQFLASVPVEGKKFSFSLQPATIPCGVMVAAGSEQAVAAVKGAGDCSGLSIKSAAWSEKKGRLSVKGKGAASSTVKLYDLDGHLLDAVSANEKGKFAFAVERDKLKSVPCGVRAVAGSVSAAGTVAGAPAGCTAMPIPLQCEITAPAEGAQLAARTDVSFKATVKADDPNTGTVKYEWDFAGGALGVDVTGSNPVKTYKRADGTDATVQFVRDNSTYRVRFIATDALGRRCEAVVNVAVGTPPGGLPAKVAEVAGPTHGAELDGKAGDLVVMPVAEWSMQHRTDARLVPNEYSSFTPNIVNLNAYVYQKDLKPVLLGADKVVVQYSAASNPDDPVGANSINSTSQNWPLGSNTRDAAVAKTDIWEVYTRTDTSNLTEDYRSISWVGMAPWTPYGWWDGAPADLPDPDEGYFQDHLIDFEPKADQPGSQMPGKSNPYVSNEPKAFISALPGEGRQGFTARMIPVSDVDDQGRVNPYPVMRVQAVQNGAVQSSTDAVLANGRDFKCRGCHIKGGIAANPDAGYKKEGFWSTAWTQRFDPPTPENTLDKPELFDAASDSIEDQEYAAALNYSSLHDFYDNMWLLRYMQYGMLLDGTDFSSKIKGDSPNICYGCHGTALDFVPFDRTWWRWDQHDLKSPAFDPDYSVAMHRFHGQMQYKSDTDKSGIQRDEKGVYVRYAGTGPNPLSLFPIFDGDGKQLPMEENCLKCHSGHREQLYRDRMYTAGVTCYDCHGDMLAMGEAYKKPADRIGADGNEYRVPWFDEPDCGSCHTGNANVGKDGNNGYFSAGVMKKAFDDGDVSATTRKVDLSHPDSSRFAVLPHYQRGLSESGLPGYPVGLTDWDYEANNWGPGGETTLKIDAPLFREGKDTHGNVPCAACHGAAHEIWPNRDPKANDNVTALQLQGHTGTILECNVCHTVDSFRNEADLDGGVYSGDPKPGILGGPHNTHPINDPYWWKEAPNDKATASGGTKGGWHNNYAQTPGKNGEDQCAACHGADHKGTRLSKTPVDREFVDENGKTVGVKAGEFVGCDLCHTLDKSFTGVPKK